VRDQNITGRTGCGVDSYTPRNFRAALHCARVIEEQPKKTPLLQLANEGKEWLKNLLAPVPASTPFTSPLSTPVLPVASRGQVSKGHFILKKHAVIQAFVPRFEIFSAFRQPRL
jgi:hypothetical protein